ncbi:hypothetical protein ABZ946_21330 [Streptomyces sp. NPDC046324]|uniref:hypothetical protein n=1 Tax=Streptomyces sp. NPDC046324 TaxID=3154915 RepID=UPI0033F2FA14
MASGAKAMLHTLPPVGIGRPKTFGEGRDGHPLPVQYGAARSSAHSYSASAKPRAIASRDASWGS